MRSLFISDLLPESAGGALYGYAQRALLLLRAAAGLGAIDVLYFTWPGVDYSAARCREWSDHLSDLLNVDVSVYLHPMHETSPANLLTSLPLHLDRLVRGATPYTTTGLSLRTTGASQVAAVTQRLDAQPSFVIVQNVSAYVPLLLMKRTLPPVVFDVDGFEYEKLAHMGQASPNLLKRWLCKLSAGLVFRSTNLAIQQSTVSLLCGLEDGSRAQEKWGESKVAVVPNAVEVKPNSQLTSRPTLTFLGKYDFPPNAEGAEYLIREIWPQIRAGYPDAVLNIAGPYPERISSFASAPPGVSFSGFIDDLEALYAETQIVVCPLLSGAGTRFKVLEAAAHGKPVVSTALGAFGLDMESGREIELCTDAAGFSGACVELLNDYERAVDMGIQAREKIIREYQAADIVATTQKIFSSALKQAGPIRQ